MQISLKWVNELVNLETVNLDELISKLTLGGFEVEETLEIELEKTKSIALDISATANRSDSISIQGLSIEMSALLNNQLKVSKYSTTKNSWFTQLENLQLSTIQQKSCLGFISLTIENLGDVTSPKWLKQKLIASGILPENNLLDFQNYVLLETGYPIELYDLEQIYSQSNTSQITLQLVSAKNGQEFIAKNDQKYVLTDSTPILKANDLTIGLSGIISSKNSSYSNNTNTLLVEASIFKAAHIRKQSRILGLRTDRSSRYEKSLKAINLFEALYRFVSLLRIANPNLSCRLHTIAQPKFEPINILELNYENIKKVLGPIQKITQNQYEYLSPKVITEILQRLQFTVTYDISLLKWYVKIPTLRSEDIVREIDLIEEIGRIYGFNNFLTRLPSIKRIGLEDSDLQIRKKLTSCLINLGLNELIQYSLVNEETYLTNEIKLLNPLVNDYSSLRSSLLPNLVQAVEDNLKKGNSVLEGFEYGHIFLNNSSSQVEEIEYIAGIFGGIKTKTDWSDSTRAIRWFEAKGRIEDLFKKLHISTYWKSYKPSKEKHILHPYSSAEIFCSNGLKLGVFGTISPILAKKLNISRETYLFEFNFELIRDLSYQTKVCVYQEYSSYPKIIKDLSFIINKNIPFNKIQKLLYLNGSQSLKEINLLDEYQSATISMDQTSLCVQFVFQSELETLQTNQIDIIIKNLISVLEKNFNAIIRT